MADSVLITSLKQAIENILHYQIALEDNRRSEALKRLMTSVHAWYAAKPDGQRWLFAPSKFVGYAHNTAEAYFAERHVRDGRRTESVLEQWFHVVGPETQLGAALDRALRDFLRVHGHSGPRKGARICVLSSIADHVVNLPAAEDRICVDAAICAGRPHIRGTRMRVSDILQLMASGVSAREILADYPYLSEVDVRAALAYGATASDHCIVSTA